MRKTMKKYGILTSVCALLCFSVGGVCAAWIQPSVEAKAAEEQATLSLAVKEAKSIRVADDNHNGIRFTATIGNYSSSYEYHFVIVPADYTTEAKGYANSGDIVGDLNDVIDALNEEHGVSMVLNDQTCTPAQVGDEDIIQASITNIKYNNVLRDFVAVAYAKPTEGEVSSADYIYSPISSPVNVTELSAELLSAGAGEADETVNTVLNGYVDTGIKKAANKAEGDAVPTLTVETESVNVNSGESVAPVIKDGDTVIEGLDFLVNGIQTEVEGLTFTNGKIKVDQNVLTRSVALSVTSSGNKLTSSEITLNVNQSEKNIFAPVYMQSDFGYGWTPIDAKNAVTRSYDETEGAMKATMVGAGANMSARSYTIFLTLDEIKYQVSQGNNILTFEAKGDEGTGFRLYNKAKSTTNNNGNVYFDEHNIGTAGNAKIYNTVTLGESEYKTVKVNLEDFIALNPAAEFIGIVFQGAQGTNVYFKNAQFRAASNDIFSDEHTLTSTNTSVVNATYDTAEEATKVVVSGSKTDGATGRNFVAYVSVDAIKEEYEAGKKGLTFQAKATAAMSINVYAKKNADRDGAAISDNASFGIAVYGSFDLTSEYATYSIDLEKFFTAKASTLAYADINYFAIVFYGEVGTVYLKNAVYTENFVNLKDYTQENLFSSVNASSWTVQGNVAKAYDETNSSLKVTAKAATDAYIQFSSNNRRIFISADQLAEAQAAGYSTFTFEYNAAALTDPGASGNYGFRVCANSTSVNGSMLNSTVGVITVSGYDGNLVTTNTWTKVEINIADVFAEGNDVKGMSIVVVGATDSYILFRNGTFAK